MEQYLFRGIKEGTNGFVYGVPVTSVNDRVYMIHGATEDAINTHNEVDFIFSEVIPSTLGIWTTKEDKNGNKIFLGDINQDGGIVEWNKDDASFVWVYKHETMPFEDEETWCEIIGNIHQTPEFPNQSKINQP